MNRVSSKIFARNPVEIDDISSVIKDPALTLKIRDDILLGDIYFVRDFCTKNEIDKLIAYLISVGKGSLPNYYEISSNCPNHHRLSMNDERAYVPGCFHQFNFFPWNQDVFSLFERFRKIFFLKNLLGGIRQDKFLGLHPEEGCTARLAFQFYPSGRGVLARHADPVDYHQLVVPTLLLSKKGDDFVTGGAFAERADGSKIDLDDLVGLGGVAFFNARIVHGVDLIDSRDSTDWLSFQGRWMLLFAVNRLHSNTDIPNSETLANDGK
jgi:hypothetical protein